MAGFNIHKLFENLKIRLYWFPLLPNDRQFSGWWTGDATVRCRQETICVAEIAFPLVWLSLTRADLNTCISRLMTCELSRFEFNWMTLITTDLLRLSLVSLSLLSSDFNCISVYSCLFLLFVPCRRLCILGSSRRCLLRLRPDWLYDPKSHLPFGPLTCYNLEFRFFLLDIPELEHSWWRLRSRVERVF